MRYVMMAAIALPCLLVIGNGCTAGLKGQSSTTGINSSAASTAQLSQNPLVSCSIVDTSTGTQVMHVTNLTQATNYSLPPAAPANVKIDCSGSTSASGGPVSVALSQNGSAATAMSGNVTTQAYPKPGVNKMNLNVTDAGGNVSTITFSLPISCNPSAYPAVNLDLSKMSITPGAGGPGFVNVSIPSATGGSGGQFNYAIDLNGDGRFDDYNQQYWNPSTTFTNMYTLYNGARTVQVTAFDTACQFEKTFSAQVDFNKILPAIQTGTMATQQSYYYLQGVVSSLSNSTDPADNVNTFDAMEKAQGTPDHVLCSYANGQFNITGANTYSDGNSSSTESLLKQQMELGWQIVDDGSAGSISKNNVSLTSLNYQTAASPDGLYNQYTYAMDTACTANVQVSRQTANMPCATGQTGSMSPVTTVLGTYSCPHLTAGAVAPDPKSRALQVTSGYFYCQIAPTNNCVGGGQGGGGQPPPQF